MKEHKKLTFEEYQREFFKYGFMVTRTGRKRVNVIIADTFLFTEEEPTTAVYPESRLWELLDVIKNDYGEKVYPIVKEWRETIFQKAIGWGNNAIEDANDAAELRAMKQQQREQRRQAILKELFETTGEVQP